MLDSDERDHIYLAIVLHDRAVAAMENERYEDARSFFRKSLNMSLRLLGSDSDRKEEVALIHHNLGILSRSTAKLEDAESYFDR